MDREEIHEIVSLFYKHPFKTFYVNSIDGKTFTKKPVGVFISLGITTSLTTMNNIMDLMSLYKDFSAKISEIRSIKIDNQFLNVLSENKTPDQYRLENIPDNVMTESESKEELNKINKSLSSIEDLDLEEITKLTPIAYKLHHLIEKLDESNSWDQHLIQKEDQDYRIFHLNVNYKQEGKLEYRIGILVTKNEKGINNNN